MDKSLDEMVEEMKLDSEAADAAKLTMDGYISQLKSSGEQPFRSSQSIASRITAALNVTFRRQYQPISAGSTPSVTTTPLSSNVNATQQQ